MVRVISRAKRYADICSILTCADKLRVSIQIAGNVAAKTVINAMRKFLRRLKGGIVGRHLGFHIEVRYPTLVYGGGDRRVSSAGAIGELEQNRAKTPPSPVIFFWRLSISVRLLSIW